MIKGQKKICYVGRITEEIKNLKKYSNQCIDYTIIFFDCKVFFEILSLEILWIQKKIYKMN